MDLHFSTIQFDVEGGIATLAMNRPAVYNALNGAMAGELKTCIDHCAAAPEVKVLVLTGNGPAFCAGQDLNEFDSMESIPIAETLQTRYNPLVMSMQNCPKIIIGKINGVATGAGMSIALGCDVRLMSASAYFCMAFVQIGLAPDCGASYLLPKLVGHARAMELCTLGRKVPASEAEAMGLANLVCADDEALNIKTKEWAGALAAGPQKAIATAKKLLVASGGNNLETMLNMEAEMQAGLGKTGDFMERVLAFRGKKKAPVKRAL